MFTKIKSFIIEYLSIFTGILFGLVFWVIDILVDVFMFKEGTISENLASPEPMEIYFRVIVGALFVAFGFHNHFVTRKRKAVETQANKSQLLYQNLFASMLNGFALHRIIVDEAGLPVDFEYLEVNQAFERMTGLKQEDIIGRRVTEVMPDIKKDSFDWIGTYGKVALNNEKMQFEQYSKALGKWYNISVYSPAKGEFASVLEDISERKKIESVVRENQERMEVIFDAVQAGIVVIDRETHLIVYANKQATQMIGAPVSDFIDRKCNKFICPASDGACPITDLHQTVDNLEKCVINIKGEMIPILKTVTPTMMGGREVLVESFVDITERKMLEEGNQLKARLLDAVSDAIVVHDYEGNLVYFNEAACKSRGLCREEMSKMNLFDTATPEVSAKKKERMEKIKQLGEYSFETEGRRKDGSLFQTEVRSTLVDLYGEKQVLSVSRDISERKRSEQELRESKSLVEAVVENIPNMVFLKEATDLRFVMFNRAGEELLGYDRAALLGKNNLDLFPPEQAAHFMAKDREVLDGAEGMLDIPEEPIQTAKRGQRLLHTKKVSIRGADGTAKYLLGISEDITERRQAEEELLKSEEKYRNLVENQSEGVGIINQEEKFVFANSAADKIFGLEKGSLVGRSLKEYLTPEGIQQIEEESRQRKDGKKGLYELEINTGTGEKKIIYVSAIPQADPTGKYIGTMGLFQDITEQKKARQETEDTRRRLEMILSSAGEGIYGVDDKRRTVFMNPAAAKLLGYSVEEMIGQVQHEVSHHTKPDGSHYDSKDCPINASITDGQIHHVTGEVFWRKDGSSFPVEYTSTPTVENGRTTGSVVVFRDITERRQAEEELRASEEKFRLITENTADTITVMDLDLKITYVSQSIQKLRGYTVEEAKTQSIDQIILPAYLPMVYKAFEEQTALEERGEDPSRTVSMELEEYRKDGTVIWAEVTMSFLRDKDLKAVGIVTMTKDITERKRAEKLQDALYHISEAAVKSEDLDTLYGQIHKRVSELISARNFYIALYHEKEDMLSFPYFVDEVDSVPQPRKLAKGLTEYVLKTGTPLLASPVVLNLLIEQGKVSMVGTPAIDWAGVPLKVGNKTLGALVVQSYREDVRFGAEALSMLNFVSDNIAQAIARKNDEEEKKKLVTELRKLSTAVEQSPSMIVVTDLEGNIEYANRAFEKITGYSIQEAHGKNVRILESGELPAEEYQRMWETISSGGEWRGQFHNKRKDGSLYWEQAAISGIRDAEGKVVKYLAVKEDITERKMMEDELRASEAQNRTLVDSAGRAGEAIVMMQNTGGIQGACLVANPEAVRITGYSQEELKRISWLDVVHPRFREESQKRVQVRLNNEDISDIYEISLISKYGVEIPVEVSGSPVQYQGRPAMVGFFRDITERKKAEAEREAMITELKEALANIKQLKGLIPICASCKKIRNDGGYWQQVEEYVSEHTEADFSHGICDECAHKLYPQYFKDKKNKTKGNEVG